mmetsp:Transcript_12924/g.15324  ORF Transcript_12924/g.15324 Transcript_12924/m.15324 type:complete len:84 (-) Transcript_12924:236-487(-)
MFLFQMSESSNIPDAYYHCRIYGNHYFHLTTTTTAATMLFLSSSRIAAADSIVDGTTVGLRSACTTLSASSCVASARISCRWG